jgi:hypothetical protein
MATVARAAGVGYERGTPTLAEDLQGLQQTCPPMSEEM